MREQAGRPFLVVVDVDVGEGLAARAVVRAVEVGHGVVQPAVHQVAAHLDAEVAVRREAGGEGAGDEAEVVRRLQALEAHRRLELAGGHLERRREATGHVRVLDHGAALAEVRREPEVVDAADRALDDRPDARRLPRVRGVVGIVVGQVASVEVQHAAQPELVLAVGRAEREAARVRPDGGGRACRGLVGLLLDLELALEHQDLLVLLLDALDQLLERRLRPSGCQWQQARGRDGGSAPAMSGVGHGACSGRTCLGATHARQAR